MKVTLNYFKEDTGKWYTDAEDDISGESWEVISTLHEMLQRGIRPGLVDGHSFNVHVTVETPHGSMDHLFVRGKNL